MLKLTKKIIDFLKFKNIVLFLIVYFLAKKSFGQAINSFFWKDDWAWLWSSNFNPEDFYHTTIGTSWYVRTGLFMYPYVLFFYKHIQNPHTWQVIGLWLKVINSLAFYLLIKSLTKKRHIAVISTFIIASYSGGIEAFTWYKLSALASVFVILGLTYYGNFLESFKRKDFLKSYILIILSFVSNMGRPAGVIPLVMIWGFLEFFDKRKTGKRRKIILSVLAFVLPYFVLIKFVNLHQKTPPGLIRSSFENLRIFFGIIGNLLKNPFLKMNELGYLADVDSRGIILGLCLFACGIVFGIMYLRKRNDHYKYLTLFVSWVFVFYYPNWVFGGGGINTVLGSGHRYLMISGIGIVGLWIIFIEYLDKKALIFITLILILFNLDYSKYLTDMESSIRNRYLVEPIYQELYEKMKNDNNVELIVIDTPNKLKSFVVGGWYPYTYAYYKGLTDITEFPVVIDYWQYGVDWACSDITAKKEIQGYAGFGNNRGLVKINPDHAYAWHLEEDGRLTDKTELFRQIINDCQDKITF